MKCDKTETQKVGPEKNDLPISEKYETIGTQNKFNPRTENFKTNTSKM